MQTFEILLYSTPDPKTKVEVCFEEETFWRSWKKNSQII
jgi:hypothetical protein